MQKETLSTSQPNQKPKIELPDKTLVGVKPSEPKEPRKRTDSTTDRLENDRFTIQDG